MMTRFVTSRDGVRISYRCSGAGRTAILLHGLQRTSDVWLPIVSDLHRERRLILPDLRGRGASDRPQNRQSYRFEHLVDDLEAVVHDVAQPVDIVGWSMGASIVLGLSRRSAACCARTWILVSPLLDPQDTRRLFASDELRQIEALARQRASERGMEHSADPYAVACTWLGLLDVDWLSDTPAIDSPVLIVHGTHDRECSAAAACSLAERLPLARLLLLPTAGHNPIVDAPAALRIAFRDFWDLPPPTQPALTSNGGSA